MFQWMTPRAADGTRMYILVLEPENFERLQSKGEDSQIVVKLSEFDPNLKVEVAIYYCPDHDRLERVIKENRWDAHDLIVNLDKLKDSPPVLRPPEKVYSEAALLGAPGEVIKPKVN